MVGATNAVYAALFNFASGLLTANLTTLNTNSNCFRLFFIHPELRSVDDLVGLAYDVTRIRFDAASRRRHLLMAQLPAPERRRLRNAGQRLWAEMLAESWLIENQLGALRNRSDLPAIDNF